MKSIDLYIDGEYSHQYKMENWIYYMAYKDAVVKRSGYIGKDGSRYESTLQALYIAIEHITEPCNITICSRQNLNFDNPSKLKPKAVAKSIMMAITKSGHTVHFKIDKEFKRVKQWESSRADEHSDSSNNNLRDAENEKNERNDYTAAYVSKHEDNKSSKTNLDNTALKITATPDIADKQTVDDVFKTSEKSSNSQSDILSEQEKLKREWEDLLGDEPGAWVPGSGGY